MKIKDINRVGSVNPYRNSSNHSQVTQTGKKGKSKDEVQFSDEALRLLQQQSIAEVSDPSRAEQLAKLKEAVSSGTYHVSSDKIADKLLAYLQNDPGQ